MIILTRGDGSRIAIHANAIDRIEEIGSQTIVHLTGGFMTESAIPPKCVVTDSMDEILEALEAEFKRQHQDIDRSY